MVLVHLQPKASSIEMKVNLDLLLQLRKDRSWSQDELALASGLNLRTIQRIEKEGSASLQSKKALASAFDIDARELDYEERSMVREILGKTVMIVIAGFSVGVKGKVVAALDEHWIKIEAKGGTELVNLNTASRITLPKK